MMQKCPFINKPTIFNSGYHHRIFHCVRKNRRKKKLTSFQNMRSSKRIPYIIPNLKISNAQNPETLKIPTSSKSRNTQNPETLKIPTSSKSRQTQNPERSKSRQTQNPENSKSQLTQNPD
jgi:hypothetical protein